MERKPHVPPKKTTGKPEPKTPQWMLGWKRREPSTSEAWAETLPSGPLVAHLTALHAILLHLGAEGDVLTVAEHSLTMIAQTTAIQDYPRTRP